MDPNKTGLRKVEGILHELYRSAGAEPGKTEANGSDGEGRRRYHRSFRPRFWTVKPRSEVLVER